MKQDIAGLIYTGERVDDLQELTRVRAVAALPMVSRYRLIDFVMSSMIHSGIRNIGIIMQKNYHSLMDHLGSGREWNLHGKRSGMTILPPLVSQDNVGTYRGFLDALHSNTGFMRGTDERFIAVSDSNILYQVDFRDVVSHHVANKADLTLLCTRDGNVRRNGRGRYICLEDGRATRLELDPMIPHFENTYIGAFVARRELLIDLVDRAASSGQHHFSRDLLAQMISERIYRVGAYEVQGRVWMVDSVQAYFHANMDFLNDSYRNQMFRDDRPVWTKLRDEMPARYAPGVKVVNALVADGCIIEGTVENSILFRGAVIKPGATVRHSIVMQDVVISRGAEVEGCILDKQVTLRENVRLVAPRAYPIVIAKNLTI